MPRLIEQAIVLREYEWSETSQIVILLTAAHGKVRGLAKGSKRLSPSSLQRFSGGIELLTAGQVVANTKRTAELANVTEWDQQRSYPRLRQVLRAQWLAMYTVELTAAMLADLDPHPGVFEAMSRLLATIGEDDAGRGDGGSGGGDDAAVLAYQWALLDDCGYRLELDRDVLGGGALVGARSYTFDPAGGGLTTRDGSGDWRVRAATVTLLRQVAAGEPIDSHEPDAVARANRLLYAYASTILDRELNTAAVAMGA